MSISINSHEAYAQSLDLLHRSITPRGLVASITDVSNYQRVWSRDSVICGLAGILAEDEALLEALKHSLESLADNQAPQGQIPSNVRYNEADELEKVSYGGLCGRVDAVTWWVIGLCNYAQASGDRAFAEAYLPQVESCFTLLRSWEFNDRGLLYVPQSGNWADEYILHAYVLYDQLLRLWALQVAGDYFNRPDWLTKAEQLRQLIRANYWLENDKNSEALYHPFAYQRQLEKRGSSNFWEASFSPGGYIGKFDLLANSLALLLGLGTSAQEEQMINRASSFQTGNVSGLMPSFWPVIYEDDPEWFFLESNYAFEFRNKPFEFQNAGIWPVFNGWWGAGLCRAGQGAAAEKLLDRMSEAVAKENWGFYECLHGQNGTAHGTPHCTWSAAGLVLLAESLNGKSLYYGKQKT